MNDEHSTALIKAVKRGDLLEVKHLLAEGADPNGESCRLFRPLAFAAMRGSTPIVRVLLAAGANPTEYEVQNAAFGNHAKTLKVLLTAGAPVDAGHGATPLLNALKWSGFTADQQTR